ncbi:ABC transporter permease [Pseudoruegeria sp. SK021]|uniref:ABC transporter permease n=1 Tax=Pseudoruegeria sp. SK021 TaxID=1933035 RepID=UPI000A233B6E|nr:ABC transporter permease [Pseudoruegeria sp. SK021]OSP54523.1 ABC transporter permease [Pseudoruegeria sp. SK021]
MKRAAAHALWSHWRRHPGQALTLVLGLALATALWTGVQAINAEARASYARATAVLTQDAQTTLIARDGGTIPVATYVRLRRAGWQVAPVLEGTTRLAGRTVTLLGLDPLSGPVLPQTAPLGSGGIAPFIGPPGQLYAAPDTAAQLNGAVQPEIVVSDDLPPDHLIGDIALVARLLGRPDHLTRLVLAPAQATDLPPLDQIAPALIRADPAPGSDLAGLTDSFHLNLTAFAALAFAVGLFIVHSAIGLAFEQRRPMYRTLRALGLSARALTGLLALELLAVALMAGLLGVAMGYGIAAALLPDVAATLRGLYGAPARDSLGLRPGWIAAGLLMSLLGTVVAGGQALWRLHRLPILASAAPRAWRRASTKGLGWQGGLAGLLLLAAGLLTQTAAPPHLGSAFASLAAMMLGAALALPPLLAGLLALGTRLARGPVAQWFWADSQQQLPGLSLALMALLLALAANIGVSTMVGSFRTTFTGWLDQRLVADVYIDAGSPETAQAVLPALRQTATAILPRITTEARLNGHPGEVQLLSDDHSYRDHWPLLSPAAGVWEGLAEGRGALINEQLAYRSGLAPGDPVTLDGTALPILAIYSDYGNPRPQAIVGAATFAALFPDRAVQRYGLHMDPEDLPALRLDLEGRFGLRPDQIIDQASIKAASLRVFEQTFTVTAALNVLTLGVAGVAILTSLLTLASLRLPQIAPLWALGMTRARLGQLELLRAGVLALFTAILALPVGLALAWILLARVNVAAFGWRLPMVLFPGDWALLGGIAVLAALAAAAWPARRLATRPAADLLKVFASER